MNAACVHASQTTAGTHFTQQAEFEEEGFSLTAGQFLFPLLCLSEKRWFLTWNNLIVFYWPVHLCLRGHSLCLQFQDNLAQHVSLAANSSYKQAKKEAVCMPFNRLA